jgi:lysozyme
MTLEEQMILHEGLRLKPYTDTVGKLTIGVGRNLTDNGITRAEALYLLAIDLMTVKDELRQSFPWLPQLSLLRYRVLVDMAFNLGVPRLKRFTRMLSALERGEYEHAAREMLKSKWAQQVGPRAVRLARWMRDNKESL